MMPRKSQKSTNPGKSKRIFIIGTDSIERDVIIELTLKGSRKMLPRVTHVKLPRLKVSNSTELSTRRKKFASEFLKLMSSERNLIVSGSLLSATEIGMVPLFEDGFPRESKPDAVVLFESDTRELIVIPGEGFARRKNFDALEEIKVQQELHRQYAGLTGSPVKILKVEKGNVKKGIRELRNYLMKMMK